MLLTIATMMYIVHLDRNEVYMASPFKVHGMIDLRQVYFTTCKFYFTNVNNIKLTLEGFLFAMT